MRNRIDFFIDKFYGLGFGGTFGYYQKTIYFAGTFLCFNIYFEVNIGKIY
jgi:hypothetical protein